MRNTTPALSNEPIGPNARLPATKPLQKDEFLEVMAVISTTASPSQKAALMAEATRVLSLNQAIAHLVETRTGR